jgi:hypothetical protein
MGLKLISGRSDAFMVRFRVIHLALRASIDTEVTTSYLKMSRLRPVSCSKSENRTALLRITLASSVAEQFPISSKITFGGAPQARLKLAKSLSLVMNAKPCSFA